METRGEIRIPDPQVDHVGELVVNALADQLTHEGAELTECTGECVSFRVPVFQAWSLRPRLMPLFSRGLDGGTITVQWSRGDDLVIRYRFTMWRAFIVVTVGVPLFFGLAAAASWQFLVGAWLWIFGGNYVLHRIRARFWLRACVRDALRPAEPLPIPHDAST